MKIERRKQNLGMSGEVGFNCELALILLRQGYGGKAPIVLTPHPQSLSPLRGEGRDRRDAYPTERQ
jgi:hypothetical protein